MKINFDDDSFDAAAKFLKKHSCTDENKSSIIKNLKSFTSRSKSGCEYTDYDGVYVTWYTHNNITESRALIDPNLFSNELEIEEYDDSSDIIEELTEYIEDNFNVGEELSHSEMYELKAHLEEVIMKLEDLGA